MSNRVIPCIIDGKIQPLPNGDTPIDAGGNSIAASPDFSNLDCSSNPNYPAASKGSHVKITVAGKIGGASGVDVEVGDVAIATQVVSAGDHATVGTYWVILNKNIVDTASAIRKRYTFTHDFILDGQNQLTSALVVDITSPVAGYLVASSAKCKNARTAGTLDIAVHKNGTALGVTGLNLQIDDNPTTKDNKTVTYGTSSYDIAAGDTIGFLVTTTSFTPLSNVITVTLTIEG